MTDRGEEGDAGAIVADGVDRIAHQLRNPLQAIAVNLEVLRLKASSAVDQEGRDEVERLAGVVNENVRLLDRRIALLVALARRSEQEAPAGLRLGRLVREAAAAFQLDERDRGRDLALDLPEDEGDPQVRARRGWLLALLIRAVDSAARGEEAPTLRVRSLPDGGGRLELGPLGPSGGGTAEGPEELLGLGRSAGGEATVEAAGLVVRFPAA